MLDVGAPAPPFSLPDQDGQPFSITDTRGRWILVWWFPKAATPG